jgi:hypothetical protein
VTTRQPGGPSTREGRTPKGSGPHADVALLDRVVVRHSVELVPCVCHQVERVDEQRAAHHGAGRTRRGDRHHDRAALPGPQRERRVGVGSRTVARRSRGCAAGRATSATGRGSAPKPSPRPSLYRRSVRIRRLSYSPPAASGPWVLSSHQDQAASGARKTTGSRSRFGIGGVGWYQGVCSTRVAM